MTLPLSGMTGFAREEGSWENISWVLEARSVNNKGLDCRLRVPSRVNKIEAEIRKIFSKQFSRGSFQISCQMKQDQSEISYILNQELYDDLAAFCEANSLDKNQQNLLQISGVVEESSKDLTEKEAVALHQSLLSSFKALASQLKVARDVEGAQLHAFLMDAIGRIEKLVEQAESLSIIQPKALQAKLMERLAALKIDDIPEDRLSAEIALLVQKSDVREELDRLKAHCEQARTLLGGGSPVGRKLDFLCQEFNREANTLCSKSSSIDLTNIGLALKNSVEQFREQAANVE